MFEKNTEIDDIAMLANLISQALDVGISGATAYDGQCDYGAEDVLAYIRAKYGREM